MSTVKKSGLQLCLLIVFAAMFGSCKSFYDFTDNTERNFRPPQKISAKVSNPLRDSSVLSVLWIGHASVLIQIDDKAILIDPLFSNSVAQVLRRYVEPGLDLRDLGKLDLVLISHSHMDHLNLSSISAVEEKFPGTPLIFPDGVEEFLPDYNLKFVRMKTASGKKEKYTGETRVINGVEITTVKAYHWGGRYGVDGKLWEKKGATGYIIRYNGKTVYFSGDTSYNKNFFTYLGENYKIDLEVISIIYCKDCDEVNQGNAHLFPRGVLKILDNTKALITIPVHYGTFTDPRKQYPVLERMLRSDDYYRGRVKILKLGEQLFVTDTYSSREAGK